MTKTLRKAIVACVLVASVGMAAGPAFAAGFFYRVARIPAFGTHTWTVNTDSTFQVIVDGDGDTDLDLYVYDAVTGRFLGKDDDGTDYCVVSGYTTSGRIRLRIENLGRVWNEYELTVR